jgi:hypothetical protein
MAWIFICFALLIGILGGIIWFQGTIITSRLSEMDSYSQQLASLKAKSGAGVTIYSDESRRTPTWWCCRRKRTAWKPTPRRQEHRGEIHAK